MSRKEKAMLTEPLAKRLPFAKLDDLRTRIDEIHEKIARRAFEIFERNGCKPGHDFDNWLSAEAELLLPAHLDLAETGDTFKIRAKVPGFSDKELRVALEHRQLTITAKHEASREKKGRNLQAEERTEKELLHVVELPGDVDASRAKATFRNGILEIQVPKVAGAKPVREQPVGA